MLGPCVKNRRAACGAGVLVMGMALVLYGLFAVPRTNEETLPRCAEVGVVASDMERGLGAASVEEGCKAETGSSARSLEARGESVKGRTSLRSDAAISACFLSSKSGEECCLALGELSSARAGRVGFVLVWVWRDRSGDQAPQVVSACVSAQPRRAERKLYWEVLLDTEQIAKEVFSAGLRGELAGKSCFLALGERTCDDGGISEGEIWVPGVRASEGIPSRPLTLIPMAESPFNGSLPSSLFQGLVGACEEDVQTFLRCPIERLWEGVHVQREAGRAAGEAAALKLLSRIVKKPEEWLSGDSGRLRLAWDDVGIQCGDESDAVEVERHCGALLCKSGLPGGALAASIDGLPFAVIEGLSIDWPEVPANILEDELVPFVRQRSGDEKARLVLDWLRETVERGCWSDVSEERRLKAACARAAISYAKKASRPTASVVLRLLAASSDGELCAHVRRLLHDPRTKEDGALGVLASGVLSRSKALQKVVCEESPLSLESRADYRRALLAFME